MFVAAGSVGLASLPVSILAVLANLMQVEISFGQGGLGTLMAIFFGAAATASLAVGRLSDRVGPSQVLAAGAAASAGSLGGIGLLAGSWLDLALLLGLGGVGLALIMVSSGHLIVLRTDPQRQGVALALVSAGTPISALIAGIALPLVATVHGWRATFASAAALAVLAFAVMLLALTRRNTVQNSAGVADSVRRPRQWMLAAGVCLASAGTHSFSLFVVSYGVGSGLEAEAAGLLFAVGGALSVSARILAGWAADRGHEDPLILAALLMAVGSAAYAALALTPTIVLAELIAFAAGWGWPALLTLAFARSSTGAPASAIATLLLGMWAGAVVGPPTFGLITDAMSYDVAWMVLSVATWAGAAIILFHRRSQTASLTAERATDAASPAPRV